jgi:hypothetical protein
MEPKQLLSMILVPLISQVAGAVRVLKQDVVLAGAAEVAAPHATRRIMILFARFNEAPFFYSVK